MEEEFKIFDEEAELYNIRKEDIVFAAMYNPMIHESSFGVLSLHRTLKGAHMALMFHKREKRKEWEYIYKTEDDREEFPFGSFEAWAVKIMAIRE